MLLDIIGAEYINEYKLKLTFENGKEGVVDFKDYSQKGGIFESLKDPKYFIKFYVNKDLGTLCWPNGLDIAPETLLAKLE